MSSDIMPYKREFINFLADEGYLKTGQEFTLKSKRLSPYFCNLGVEDGLALSRLGAFYVRLLRENECEFDSVYGPPDKGTCLALATAMEFSRELHVGRDRSKGFFYNRTKMKDYGDAAGDRAKGMIVGRVPKDGERIVMVDDVFTTGDTKYEALEFLTSLADVSVPCVVVGVDRMETDASGGDAVGDFTAKTRINVYSVVDAVDIIRHCRDTDKTKVADDIEEYLNEYGTERAHEKLSR